MINLQEGKKVKDEIVSVRQQEKKKTKTWMNSIEPRQGHNLYEFFYHGDHFTCNEINLSSIRPAFILVNINGEWVNKEKKERAFIDIFNPDFKAKKNIITYDFNANAIYITALNYTNACKKLKTINSHLFN